MKLTELTTTITTTSRKNSKISRLKLQSEYVRKLPSLSRGVAISYNGVFFVVFLVKITFHLHLMDIQQFAIIFYDYSILITTNNSNKNYTKTCIPFERREIIASFEVGVLLRKCICYIHTYKKNYPANNFESKLTRISLLKYKL